MDEDELSNRVIGMAIKVHRALGPGLPESSYKECLFYEVDQSGILVEKEKPMPLVYEGVKLNVGYRIYLVVDRNLLS